MSLQKGATALSVAQHYENFPVGSWLVPQRLRPAFAALYRFARYADDIADEGDDPPEQRMAELARLHAALDGQTTHPVVAGLTPYIERHGLEPAHLHDLLSAFEQDVRGMRYADFAAVLDYCSRSANPVGALVLELFGRDDSINRRHSDAICSALQLINFLQDLAEDWQRGRLYLALDELHQAGLAEADIAAAVTAGRAPATLRALIARQSRRAQAMLESGAPLLAAVPARLRFELRAVLAGASRVLAKLERGGFDPIARRPALGWSDALPLLRLWLFPIVGHKP